MTLYKVLVDISGALYFNADDGEDAFNQAEKFFNENPDEALEVAAGNGCVVIVPGDVFEVVVDRPPPD